MRQASAPNKLSHGWVAVAMAGSVALVVIVAVLLRWNRPGPGAKSTRSAALVVYCAAGLKEPVEEAGRHYQAEYGVAVQLQYGGSHTLLSNAQLTRMGDLYIPGDDSYIDLAREKGLLAEVIPLARMRAVVAVKRGNPLNIRGVDDLLRGDVRVSQANPDAAAIGKLTREALRRSGQWEALQRNTRVFKGTVSDVLIDVKIGAADAGVVWDAIVRPDHGVDVARMPQLEAVAASVPVAVLVSSAQPTAALRFARYLSAADKGLASFSAKGFEVVQGDPWSPTPELRLLSGAMLRPAVERTIATFEAREGVRVTRVYNGCGILVAQMKAGERPDAYFSCDRSFMAQVSDLFMDEQDISQNQLVIIVPRGNPRGIHRLADLAAPGLRIGVGHEQQSALGELTRRTLEAGGAYAAVQRNVRVASPTGDMLVNQLLTGSLDAVIAYVSNAKPAADKLTTVPIDLPSAIAVQPIAVGKQSRQKQLTRRLVDAIRAGESRQRFLDSGFVWKAGEK